MTHTVPVEAGDNNLRAKHASSVPRKKPVWFLIRGGRSSSSRIQWPCPKLLSSFILFLSFSASNEVERCGQTMRRASIYPRTHMPRVASKGEATNGGEPESVFSRFYFARYLFCAIFLGLAR